MTHKVFLLLFSYHFMWHFVLFESISCAVELHKIASNILVSLTFLYLDCNWLHSYTTTCRACALFHSKCVKFKPFLQKYDKKYQYVCYEKAQVQIDICNRMKSILGCLWLILIFPLKNIFTEHYSFLKRHTTHFFQAISIPSLRQSHSQSRPLCQK